MRRRTTTTTQTLNEVGMEDFGEEFLDHQGNLINLTHQPETNVFKQLFYNTKNAYDSFESLILYELPYFYQENERLVITSVVVLLNSLMMLSLFFADSRYYGTVWKWISIILALISMNNAVLFFKTSKQYQLWHAQTTDAEQRRSYVLRGVTQHTLGQVAVDLSKTVEEEEIEQTTRSQQSNVSITVEVLKFIINFLFKFVTCSLFSSNSSARKPSMARKTPSSSARSVTVDQNKVWELTVWNYSQLQKTVFCFFSPLQAIGVAGLVCCLPRIDIIYKAIIIVLCFGQAIYVNTLVDRFEQKDSDRNLLHTELSFENMLHAERVWNAARLLLLNRDLNTSIPSAPALDDHGQLADGRTTPVYHIMQEFYQKRDQAQTLSPEVHTRAAQLERQAHQDKLRLQQIEAQQQEEQRKRVEEQQKLRELERQRTLQKEKRRQTAILEQLEQEERLKQLEEEQTRQKREEEQRNADRISRQILEAQEAQQQQRLTQQSLESSSNENAKRKRIESITDNTEEQNAEVDDTHPKKKAKKESKKRKISTPNPFQQSSRTKRQKGNDGNSI